MLVENNWITTNLLERSQNNQIDFNVTITPYKYYKVPFSVATKSVANKIAELNKPIYIAFSGGSDSEYVVRTFKQLNIPFSCVTVNTNGNIYEIEYANRVYKEFPEIQKQIIDFTNPKEFLSKYIDIVKMFGSRAINSVGYLEAAKYIKSQNGIMVTGDSFIGYSYDGISKNRNVEVSEWDFYSDIIDTNLAVPFFFYDLPMINSFVSLFDDKENEEFKSQLYYTVWRPKFKTHFRSSKIYDAIEKIDSSVQNFSKKEVYYKKEEFLSLIG